MYIVKLLISQPKQFQYFLSKIFENNLALRFMLICLKITLMNFVWFPYPLFTFYKILPRLVYFGVTDTPSDYLKSYLGAYSSSNSKCLNPNHYDWWSPRFWPWTSSVYEYWREFQLFLVSQSWLSSPTWATPKQLVILSLLTFVIQPNSAFPSLVREQWSWVSPHFKTWHYI